MTVFETLNQINVNDKVETKGRLKYLSWPYAWGELKKRYPNATYTVYENIDGWNYHHDGRTAWVKTGVTVDGIEYVEFLPVMDNFNRSIPLEKITSFDVNKRIQRSLTKRIRRHGLGLYIYRAEDLPDAVTGTETADSGTEPPKAKSNKGKQKQASQAAETPQTERKPKERERRRDNIRFFCEQCKNRVPLNVAKRSKEIFQNHVFCSKACRAANGFIVDTDTTGGTNE